MDSWQTAIPVVGVILLSTVVVGGTAGDLLTDQPDPDDLVEAVVTAPEEFDTLNGVRTRETTITRVSPERSGTSMIREEVWLDPPNKSRVDVIATNSTSVAAEGDVLLINQTTLKRYKADHEVMSVDRNWEAGDYLLDSEVGLDNYEAEYRGTETVAGRQTHVVEIEPKPNASVQAALTFHLGGSNFGVMTVRADRDSNATIEYTTTWWIDAENLYPVKERVEIEPSDPQSHPGNLKKKVQTIEYERIRFNASIPDSRFRFTPPNGTDVHQSAQPLGIDTVAEADQAAPFAVPDPPLPERFELVQAYGYVLRDNVSVSFLYSDGNDLSTSDTVHIEWNQRVTSYAEKRIIEENAGEINATVVEYASGPMVAYDCGEVRVEITADIEDRENRDFAIELAESMACDQ